VTDPRLWILPGLQIALCLGMCVQSALYGKAWASVYWLAAGLLNLSVAMMGQR
jgi:hypothetical protein